jgi:hypothetical protein
MPQLLSATRTVAQDLADALTRVMTQAVAPWAPTLDSAIAEAIIDALVLNEIRPLHHVTTQAEIFVWWAFSVIWRNFGR